MALERLQKVMAEAGVASRRHAEEMIAAGRVTVNGEVVREMGVKVDPERDRIEVDGNPLTPEAKVYLALNKPDGVVTTVDDPEERQTVLDLLPDNVGRVYPVGRLDMDSQGLLLLTNDGDLAYRLTHPSFEHEKEYKIRVSGHPSERLLADLARGIELEDGPTLPAEISILQKKRDATWLRVVLHEGRKRQLRRMFEAIDHPVRDLIRMRVGPIQLGDLPPGQWRHLSAKEVQALRRLAAGEEVDIVRPPSSRDRNAARTAGIAAAGAAGVAAASRAGQPRRDEPAAPSGRGRRVNDDFSRGGERPARPGQRPSTAGRGRPDEKAPPRDPRPGPERRPRRDDDDDEDWWMRDERPPRRGAGSPRPPARGGSGRPAGGGGRPATGGSRSTSGGGRPASSGDRPASSGGSRSTSGGRPGSGGGRTSSGGSRPASGGGRTSSGGSRPASGGGRPTSSGGSRPASGGGRPASSGGSRPAGGGSGRPPARGGSAGPTSGSRPSSTGGSRSSGSGSPRPASGGSRPPSRGGSRPPSSGGRRSTGRPPSQGGSKRGGPKR